MITTNGKLHIKRYLAQFVPSIAQSIAFGVGDLAESVDHVKLQFETERADITLISYDFVNNKLIYKASVPEEFSGKIYEAAIYSMSSNSAAGEFGSRILTTFDSATEVWVDATSGTAATFNSTNTRIGVDSMRHTPSLSTSKTDTMRDVVTDLSGYSSADKFVLAYNVGNSNTSDIIIRFLTDTSNYYSVSLGTQTSGYKITEATKGSATATGTPDWGNITEIRIVTTSGAGGASSVDYDGLRIEDMDTMNSDYVMVSREVLASPYTKQDGRTQEIEFSLDVVV